MQKSSVDHYLKQLRRSARHLPAGRRRELILEIQQHLSDSLGDSPTPQEVELAIGRLGSPTDIVAEEYARLEAQPPKSGVREWLAVTFLLIGGVVIPGIGWFVGAALLWTSRIWTMRDKIVGTLLLPGGLVAAALLGLHGTHASGRCSIAVARAGGVAAQHCTTTAAGTAVTLLAVLVILPIISAAYLGVRAGQKPIAAV